MNEPERKRLLEDKNDFLQWRADVPVLMTVPPDSYPAIVVWHLRQSLFLEFIYPHDFLASIPPAENDAQTN